MWGKRPVLWEALPVFAKRIDARDRPSLPAAVPVLSTRFSFEEPALWFARARLLDDAIELTGWRLTGRYQRRIPLHTIVEVDAPTSDCLLLWFTTGRTLRLRLDDAARWKRAIETRRRDADAS
jgi:hypothetical protein